MRAFVNYRSKNEGSTALLVSRHLCARLGEKNVFLDTRSIEPGVLFDDELLKHLWRSDVMVSVMGVGWLDFPGRAGRAIDDPEDWVHRELVEALNHQVRVVPFLVNGATFPTPDDLPPRLAALARRQYVAFDVRAPDVTFARLDKALGIPSAREGTRKAPGRQAGSIGSVRGNRNITITNPNGPLHIGDRSGHDA